MKSFALALLLSLASLSAHAVSDGTLTLDQALAAATDAHPDLALAVADQAMAAADRDLAAARGDWSLNLEAGLRQARPSTGPDAVSDNTFKHNARKSLYDFGRTTFATQAAERRQFTPQMQSMLLAVAGAARNTRIALEDSSNDKSGNRRD